MEYWFRKLFPKTKFLTKNIINYFIGNYLKEELNEDQIELIEDYAHCTGIQLDVKVINDLLYQKNIPINLLYGFIGTIKIVLPWKQADGKLLFEIDDLELSFGPALRNSSPDPEVVFGSMIDSMITMQRSFQEEEFSSLIFQEKHRGKNFNALLSKWISKLCFKLTHTRLNFESRPIPESSQCCRFCSQIDLISLETKETDSVNFNTSTLLGILLRNNIEISGVSVHWEVGAQNSDPSELKSMASCSTNCILFGCQILSITNTITINYTLLLNNPEPEFEIHFNVDQLHVLLAPLQIHWLQLIVAQCFTNDYDPTLSKNVRMTDSQFESFFPNDDHQSNSSTKPFHQNIDSIYYDVNSSMDNFSMKSTSYDEVPLDNSDYDDNEDSQTELGFNEFFNDTATCNSLSSTHTFFDEDGKMNTNFKATVAIKSIGFKILLQNPLNEFDCLEQKNCSPSKQWKHFSTQYFGLLKRNNNVGNKFDSLLEFHNECDASDFISIYLSNTLMTTLTKIYSDKYHKSFELSCDEIIFSETLAKSISFGTDNRTFQLLSVESKSEITNNLDSKKSALNLRVEYNSMKNEFSLVLNMDHCSIGCDISIQDRLGPLMENHLMHFAMSEKQSSYELNKSSKSSSSSVNSKTTNNEISCVAIANIRHLEFHLRVPIINMNKDVSYWQCRMLHSEWLVLTTNDCRIMLRIPGQVKDNINRFIEVHSPCLSVDLHLSENDSVPLFTLFNNQDDPEPTVLVKLKRVVSPTLEEVNDIRSHSNKYSGYGSIPQVRDKHKKYYFKPYNTKESSVNNSSPKIIYTPAKEAVVNKYIKNSIKNSLIDIEINVSHILGLVTNQDVLELLYHRLAFDLVLWESVYEKRNNMVIMNYKRYPGINCNNLINEDYEESDDSYGDDDNDNGDDDFYDDDDEGDRLTEKSYRTGCGGGNYDDDNDEYGIGCANFSSLNVTEGSSSLRSKMKYFQPKRFTLKLNANNAKIYLQTNNDKTSSETVLHISQLNLFSDSDIIQGLVETQSIFICQMLHFKVLHNAAASIDVESNIMRLQAYDSLQLNDDYVCVIDKLPNNLMDVVSGSNNSINIKDLSTSDGGGSGTTAASNRKMVLLIMDTHLNKCKNYKSLVKEKASTVVTAQLKELCLRHRYTNDTSNGLGWLNSLMDILSLNNPIITGYTLPDSDTILHLHMDNCGLDMCFSHFPLAFLTLIKKVQMDMTLNSTESYCLNCDISFSGCQSFIKKLTSASNNGTSTTPGNINISISNNPKNWLNDWLNQYFRWNNYNWFSKSILNMGYIYILELGNLDLRFSKIGSMNTQDKSPCCSLILTNTDMSLHVCGDSLKIVYVCLSLISQESNDLKGNQSNSDLKNKSKNSKTNCDVVNNDGESIEEGDEDDNNDDGAENEDEYSEGSVPIFKRNTSTKVLKDMDTMQCNDLISDAIRDVANDNYKKKRDSDEFSDDFLLIDDKLMLSSAHDRVRSLEELPSTGLNKEYSSIYNHNFASTSINNKLSVVMNHYRPVMAEEDKYSKIRQRLLYAHSASSLDRQSSSKGSTNSLQMGINYFDSNNNTELNLKPNSCIMTSNFGIPPPDSSLLVHDFSLSINIYAGSDFDTADSKQHLSSSRPPQHPLQQNQSDGGTVNIGARRSKNKMSTSMNIKFQRFPSNNTTTNISGIGGSGGGIGNKSSKITIQSSDYDAYFGDGSARNKINRGGVNRKLKESYRICFAKIFFRYDNYLSVSKSSTPLSTTTTANEILHNIRQTTPPVSNSHNISQRILLQINSCEIISNNINSRINKNLFHDTDAQFWYDPKAPMLNVKMVYYLTNPDQDVLNEECDIKLSIQPIRLNIDQELIVFLESMGASFNSISGDVSAVSPNTASSTNPSQSTNQSEVDAIVIAPSSSSHQKQQLSLGHGGGIDSIMGSSPLSRSSTVRAPAFDELAVKRASISSIELNQQLQSQPQHYITKIKSNSSVFIRSFSIFPDVSIRIDYSGTRFDFTQGVLKGLVYLLMQLNNVIIIIKQRKYVQGITGFFKLFQMLSNEIREEILSQLMNFVTKIGPISELTELLSGVYEFFSLPFQHYQNRESVIEGLKLGTRSITSRSLWAALTLLSKGLKLFQKMAETTYELVSPEQPIDYNYSDDHSNTSRDLREGVTNAAYGVSRRFRHTAHGFESALSNSTRPDRPGVSRFGDIMRQVPPAMASPFVATFEASTQLVDGLRYQLRPELRAEEEKKWK